MGTDDADPTPATPGDAAPAAGSSCTADHQGLLDHAVDTTLVLDDGGVLLAASRSFATAFGHDVDALVGHPVHDLIHPEDQASALASLAETIAAGGRRIPLRCRARDGEGRWRAVELVANAVAGPPPAAVLSVRDRTGEEGFEEMLADRSELYRQIVELTADGVWIIDKQHRTTFASAPMADMLGVTAEDMLGRTIFEFMDDDGVAIAEANIERRRRGLAEDHPFEFRHSDGHPVWTQMRTRPIGSGDPYVGAVALVTDVSEQVRESELRELQRSHLRGVLDALPDLFFEFDAEGRYLDVSAAQADLLLAPADELIGRSVHDVLPAGHATVVAAAIRRTLDTGLRQEFDFELDIDGAPVDFQARMSPSGPHSVVTIVRDVTELRAAERARLDWAMERQRREDAERRASLERRLQGTARLDALGRLSAGVAHDVNNLLGVIGNYSAVIRRSSSDPVLLEDLDGIDGAVRQGSELTRRMLRFGRVPGSAPERVDVAELVAGVVDVIRRSGTEDVDVEVASGAGAAEDGGAGGYEVVGYEVVGYEVVVDRAQLEQAVMNLVINAVDASPADGTVEVRVEHAVRAGRSDAQDDGPLDGGSPDVEVRVSVLDRGPGIPLELHERVVEPFFTTKAPGEGTGLGLSVAHSAMQEAGGALEIAEREGGGAQLSLVLPLADGGRAAHDAHGGPDDGAAPGVVVVDDDPAGLASITRLLRAHGLRVEPAGSADAAETLLEGDTSLRCVLSDVMMPGRSGVDLDRRLRRTRPDVLVVLMTGFADAERVLVPTDRVVLAKPVAADEVLAELSRGLWTSPATS